MAECANDEAEQKYDESRLRWRCVYCNRKTSYSPDRLVRKSGETEPSMGLVITNNAVICIQCQHELEEAD